MYIFILVVWTATTASSAYYIYEKNFTKVQEFTREESCKEAKSKLSNKETYECLKVVK